MGIAVSHPCAPSNAPESSPRCDVMSGMRELLWPDRISAIQPKSGDERRSDRSDDNL